MSSNALASSFTSRPKNQFKPNSTSDLSCAHNKCAQGASDDGFTKSDHLDPQAQSYLLPGIVRDPFGTLANFASGVRPSNSCPPKSLLKDYEEGVLGLIRTFVNGNNLSDEISFPFIRYQLSNNKDSKNKKNEN